MATSKLKIESSKDYKLLMKKIDTLMRKGENMSEKDAKQLRRSALAAQAYEKSQFTIKPPKSLPGIVELEMYKRKLKQKEMARLLDVGEAKLSQILSNKREPDVALLKAVHEKLGVDGNLLLKYV